MVSNWMGARCALQYGGSVVNLVFGGGMFQVEPLWSSGPLWRCLDVDSSRYGRAFIRGRRWLSSWTMDVVAEQVPNIQRELTSTSGRSFPEKGEVLADGIWGNLYCLARELAFWWCGRVSLLITQVKLQRAWSMSTWMGARYTLHKHYGSVHVHNSFNFIYFEGLTFWRLYTHSCTSCYLYHTPVHFSCHTLYFYLLKYIIIVYYLQICS
jgi:hypothetical protein